MFIEHFSDRAAECMQLAARSRSEHDRRFFVAMARAWRGVRTEGADKPRPPARRH